MAAKRKRKLASRLALADELAVIRERDQATFYWSDSGVYYGTLRGGRSVVVLCLRDENIDDIDAGIAAALERARSFGAAVLTVKKPSLGGVFLLGMLGFVQVQAEETFLDTFFRLQPPDVGSAPEGGGIQRRLGPLAGAYRDGEVKIGADIGGGVVPCVRFPVPRMAEVMAHPTVQRSLGVLETVNAVVNAVERRR